MKETGHERTAIVLYGTETGTSQDVAEEVYRLTQRLHFETDVAGFDDVTAGSLSKYTITVFVIATTGQGDFPSNALSFWKSLLKKKLPRNFYRGLHYALVGLGDSSYPKYNWAARKLEKRLQQLGAEPVLESCEADEQDDEGTDGAIVQWLQSLPAALLSTYPLPEGRTPISQDQPIPSRWDLSLASDGKHTDGEYVTFPSTSPDHDSRRIPHAVTATLTKNDRVTPSDHWQDVRQLTLVADEKVQYLPGDALAIMPKNFSADVDVLISLMNWGKVADSPIVLRMAVGHNSASHNIRPPCQSFEAHQNPTLRTLLTEYLDITAIPRRSFFAAMARYTENKMQKERLLEFTDPQLLDEYFDYTTRPRRSILEILQEFDSVRIPWQEAINVFPLIRPRQFSIASGGNMVGTHSKSSFELLVAIVKYRTVIKKIRQGVCTRYLAALPVGSVLKVVLRTEGRFHLDYDIPTRHNLLIGAGTGIAPLRALIQEQSSLSYPRELRTGTNTLFFGARSEKADFFFKDEWAKLTAVGEADFKLITAFSRDQKQKLYVQDRIRESGKTIADLLCNLDAHVFVCGSSGAMPKAVREALIDVMAEYASIDEPWTRDDAKSFLDALEKQGRYIQETW
jgi:sulfite reductase alpha subunit-like flavoprotein